MTTPPPGWQPNQQPGPFPPQQGGPYGQQPGFSPQQPPPQGWQQGPWQQPPPPAKGSTIKWLLIAVAVLLVIAISVGGTLLLTRDGGGGGETMSASSPPARDIASAGDTGPVAIITEEPTCQAFVGINNALGDVQSNGWGTQRSEIGPASEWSQDQRAQVEAVAAAMLNAADQTVPLVSQTPHRVIRELYAQFIAYGRAYAASIQSYTPSDNGLASANVNATSAVVAICNAITTGSASRSAGVESGPGPQSLSELGNPADPRKFIESSNPSCTTWITRLDRFNADTTEWAKLDSNIPAYQWPPARRVLEQSVQPLIETYADDIQAAGMSSGNSVFEDFAVTAALYLRAYLRVGDSYTSGDGWLSDAAFRIANVVSGACRAVAN